MAASALATSLAAAGPDMELAEDAVVLQSLSYGYPGHPKVLSNMTLTLPAGSRCLLCGANAAGKTTLLHLLAGKALVGGDAVRVLGVSPFHDTELTVGGDLSYLGASWRRSVSCAGSNVPLQGDFPAGKMIYGVKGADPVRRERLIELLDIDCSWSMMEVSDGQRRRVQICIGLLRPYKVLLCDEITVDLDVVGRLDLLNFFSQECEERGATIIYATHIFDGMEKWLTHIAYVENGEMARAGPVSEACSELADGQRLLRVMEEWLRCERDERRQRMEADAKKPPPPPQMTNPFGLASNSKHLAFYR